MGAAFVWAWILTVTPLAVQDHEESLERRALSAYLAELQSGQPGRASEVDRYGDLPFPCFLDVVRSYIEAPVPLAPHSHQAYQALLERMSRGALLPWGMIRLYSEEFASFLSRPLAENVPASALFKRLLDSGALPQACDLTVRLTPEATLRHLASNSAALRLAIFQAWNRRLSRGPEKRPIPGLGTLLDSIQSSFSLSLAPEEMEARLRFIASWPTQRSAYLKALDVCLGSDSIPIVLAGLAAQERMPALLDRNEALVIRFRDSGLVVERAIRNFAIDSSEDHSATLRAVWKRLRLDERRARFNCLLAMAAHPRGNEKIALDAVLADPLEMSEASPILAQGTRDDARKAIRHVLASASGGEEAAIRLASSLDLKGFEEDALRLAADAGKDQIVRQRAMDYLGKADGETRRRLLSFLASRNSDLRLSAVQMFGEREGLAPSDMAEVGPLLIRIALEDLSMGHREEAIHALGRWKNANTEEFFRKLLREHSKALPGTEVSYWSHRFTVEALLGLAGLGDVQARAGLLDIHRRGGPLERMNVLLAFGDLGEAPEISFEDLGSTEPKLVATAAHLIARYGGPAMRARLREFFLRSPLRMEFQDSGIDYHGILQIAGVR